MALPGTTHDRLAGRAARSFAQSYSRLDRQFLAVTRRAGERFLARDWTGARADAVERLLLYRRELNDLVAGLDELLGGARSDERLWRRIRLHYTREIAWEQNDEMAKTFFNSITRRVFSTVGVNPAIEFLSRQSAVGPHEPEARLHDFGRHELTPALVESMLLRAFPAERYRDLPADARLACKRIRRYLLRRLGTDRIESAELLQRRFFRDRGAYLIGRLRCANAVLPLVLALRNDEDGAGGVFVDAVLMNEDEVSILFSFTRSYFRVDSPCPRRVVAFLKSIIPRKSISELYTSLGHHRHGKTELYRDLQNHLAGDRDRFEIAPGDRGMVMLVFTLQAYDIVFKVIRDRFAHPKKITHQHVRDRYRFVFEHDRVGRLVDAQEFEHLSFPRRLFAPDLLRELQSDAAGTVSLDGDEVAIDHLYTERKITPLNLYLRGALEDDAMRAVIDYGNAIRELAASNVFPGDFLLKNFGVTRHGRVVFYDYDELCLLTECRFRRIPPARNEEQELAAEPWFAVADEDVFPEEFRKFLGLGDRLREVYERHHGELYDVDWWREMQERHRRGEVPDVRPYAEARRLRR